MKIRMAIVLASIAFAACGTRAERPENLVLVVIDTLRQDHVGVYGAAPSPTPFLDQLAREGCMADGRSPTSWTRPAMATVFSGLHPLVHQVISPSDLVSPSVPLLSEQLDRSGFATVAVIGNSVVAKKWGFGRGFDRFVDVQSDLGRLPSAEEINRQVAAALEGVRPPYFLYVHYMDPHLPYDPDRDRLGRPLDAGLEQAGPVTDEPLRAALAGEAPLDSGRIRDLYDREVRRADDGSASS
ncbi:MAG: sulfatase-like hydrolase/transferase [Thermoanaerobaculia bacterium]